MVEWWSGFAQIMGFVDAVPPPWLLLSGFVSLLLPASFLQSPRSGRVRSGWQLGFTGAGSFVSKLFNGWQDIG